MNQNIFDLIENPKDLPSSNENMAEMYYREILPLRNIKDAANDVALNVQLAGNNVSFRWNFDNRTWWLPSRSYFRIKYKLTYPGNPDEPINELSYVDGIAPNMNMGACFWNNITFKMNDIQVSKISQFIPQIETMQKRIYNSRDTLNKNTLSDSNYGNPYHEHRLRQFVANGKISEHYYSPVTELQQNYNVFTRQDFDLGTNNVLGTYDYIKTVGNELTFPRIGNNPIYTGYRKYFKAGDLILIKGGNVIPNTYSNLTLAYFIYRVNDNSLTLASMRVDANANDLGSANEKWSLEVLRPNCPMRMVTLNGAYGGANFNNLVLDVRATSNFDNGAEVNIKVGTIFALNNVNGQICYSIAGGYQGGINSFGLHINGIAQQTNAVRADVQWSEEFPQWTWNPISDYGFGFNGITDARNNNFSYVLTNPNAQGTFNTIMGFVPLNGNNIGFTSRTFKKWDIICYTRSSTEVQAANDVCFFHTAVVLNPSYGPNDNAIEICTSNTPITITDFNGYLNTGQNAKNTVIGFFRICGETVLRPDQDVSWKVNIARQKPVQDIIWKPSCLSIFNYPGALPGGCTFEIEMNATKSKYASLAVETYGTEQKRVRDSDEINNRDFQLIIEDIKLYICQLQGPIVGDSEYAYYINMNECRAHTQQLISADLTQTSIDVMPSSYALALAFQDRRADDAIATNISISKLRLYQGKEQALSRYSLRFAGLSVPQPEADIERGLKVDYLMNSYISNQMFTNAFFKPGGGESYADWIERGLYFYHPFIRTANNKEGRVYIQTEFNKLGDNDEPSVYGLTNTDIDNTNIVLFEFYRSFALIKMKNGYVYDVRTANQ